MDELNKSLLDLEESFIFDLYSDHDEQLMEPFTDFTKIDNFDKLFGVVPEHPVITTLPDASHESMDIYNFPDPALLTKFSRDTKRSDKRKWTPIESYSTPLPDDNLILMDDAEVEAKWPRIVRRKPCNHHQRSSYLDRPRVSLKYTNDTSIIVRLCEEELAALPTGRYLSNYMKKIHNLNASATNKP